MKKQEPKAAELAQNARKNMNDAAEATRKAAGDASAKISKLMGSSPEPSFDESGAMAREDAAPSESRLDKLKAAFKPKENPEVGALRAEVAELGARGGGGGGRGAAGARSERRRPPVLATSSASASSHPGRNATFGGERGGGPGRPPLRGAAARRSAPSCSAAARRS